MSQDLIKKIREDYERQQDELRLAQEAEQVSLQPTPADPTAIDPQHALDRTVATIKKVNEIKAGKEYESIQDLTKYTTLYDIYTRIEAGKYYTLTIPLVPEIANNGWNGQTVLAKCITKDASKGTASLGAFQAFPGEYYTMHFDVDFLAKTMQQSYYPMFIGEPTGDHHATTKTYVDGLVAAKANGNIKVQSVDGTQHDISGFDGSIDDKLLASLKFIEGTFETQADLTTKLATKQDTLTKTLTLHWDDGTTEDIKVG